MKKLILAAVLSAVSAASFAAAPAWDFVQASYVMTDFDDADLNYEPDGFAISASKLVTDDAFVTGSYSIQNDDIFGSEIDFDRLSLVLGYRYALSGTTDFFGIVSYEDVEISGSGESESEDGYGLTAGVSYETSDDLSTFGLNARYNF